MLKKREVRGRSPRTRPRLPTPPPPPQRDQNFEASAASSCCEEDASFEVATFAASTSASTLVEKGENWSVVEFKTEFTAEDVRAGDYPDEEYEARYDDRRGDEAEVA